MGKKIKNNMSINILLGVGIAITICLITTAVMAKSLLTGKIGEGSLDLIVSTILLLSVMIGTFVAGKRQSKQEITTIAITTVVVILTLLLCGLLLDGKFCDVPLRIGTVVGGGLISYVLCLKLSGKSPRRKNHYR